MERYIEIEDKILEVIGKRFNCELHPMHPAIHEADKRLLATEQRDVMDGEITVQFQPYDWHIESVGSIAAEVNFLVLFDCLVREKK
jgi:hypothetical protein